MTYHSSLIAYAVKKTFLKTKELTLSSMTQEEFIELYNKATERDKELIADLLIELQSQP